MQNQYTKHYISKLKKILLKVCHDPKCKTITICPNKCKCRKQRKFKLNTETAMCWELARHLTTHDHTNIIKVMKQTRIYYLISLYHMSKGWQRFFWNIEDILLKISSNNYVNYKILQDLRKIKININKLKRDKK